MTMNDNKLVSLDDAALDAVNGGWSIGFGDAKLASGGGTLSGGFLSYTLNLSAFPAP